MARKKIYYVPGLISLLFLPLVWSITLPEEREIVRPLYMLLPSDSCGTRPYSNCEVLKIVSGKKVVAVEFYANPSYAYHHDIYYRKLNFVRKQVEYLSYGHDTTCILKVVMGGGITYGGFVSLLRLLNDYGVRRYALVNDSLFVFGNPMPDPPAYED